MLLFKSYTITSIDEEDHNLKVEFTFEDNGKTKKVKQTLNYSNDMGYDTTEKRIVAEQVLDEKGETYTRQVERDVPVVKMRKAFDVSDKDMLDKQLKTYAFTYALGELRKDDEAVKVSEEVANLIGVQSE